LHFQFSDGNTIGFAHFWQRVNPLPLLFDFRQLGMAHDHGIDHRVLFKRKLILTQFTEPDIRLQHHLAGRGFQVTTEDFHERRFAAAVGTNQAVSVTLSKADVDVFEQWLGAKLHGDIGRGDHSDIRSYRAKEKQANALERPNRHRKGVETVKTGAIIAFVEVSVTHVQCPFCLLLR